MLLKSVNNCNMMKSMKGYGGAKGSTMKKAMPSKVKSGKKGTKKY